MAMVMHMKFPEHKTATVQREIDTQKSLSTLVALGFPGIAPERYAAIVVYTPHTHPYRTEPDKKNKGWGIARQARAARPARLKLPSEGYRAIGGNSSYI